MKPQDGYISYIINPKSGSSSSKAEFDGFKSYLSQKGFKVRTTFTTSLEHARQLAADAAVDYDCAMIVVVGGDGTVREVAHGLESSSKPLLILAAGTENLLSNELGFDDTLKTLIKAFEDGEIKPFDLGKLNDCFFTSIAGFGFDGRIVKRVDAKRQGHITHLDYFWPIWRTFWDYKFPVMKVEVDGEEIFNGKCMVFVGNISRYATGLQILHWADFSDGLLDVCIYKCAGRIHLAKHSFMTAIKQHYDCSDVIYHQGKVIDITSPENERIESEIDGDPGPAMPGHIEIIPKAVNLLVPKDAKPAGIRTRLARTIG